MKVNREHLFPPPPLPIEPVSPLRIDFNSFIEEHFPDGIPKAELDELLMCLDDPWILKNWAWLKEQKKKKMEAAN